MSNVAEVENYSGGNPDVVLRISERIAVEIIRLNNTNRNSRAEVPVKTAASSEGASHAFDYAARRHRNADIILGLAEKSVKVKLRFVAAPGVLRADHVMVRRYL